MGERAGASLSIAESAALLGKSTKTVRRYIKAGLLPCQRVGGKFGPEIRVPRKALETLVRDRSRSSEGSEDPYLVLQLYRQASPETREVVRKILTSTPEEHDQATPTGFRMPFFRKKSGERR